MPSNMLKGVLVATSALCAFQAAPAVAQDMLGEIVVTARRTEERLQDVPISVTVFNQEQIAKQNIVNLTDLALYTPSLGTTNVLGNAQTTFSLRGFNQELTTAATVGVFFADVVAPRGASNQQPAGDGAGPGSFFDLQNVQVLKGPQGTLFGRNTTGGAILLVPQKPSDQLEGYIEGSVGNYQMKRIQGVFNAPLGEKGRVRIGLDRQYRDGYVKNLSTTGPSRFNDIDYTAGRFSLVLDPTDNLENYTIASFVHSKTNGEVNSVVNAEPTSLVTIPGLGTLPFANGSPVVGAFAYLAGRELARYGRDNFYVLENNIAKPRTELTQYQVINTTTWRASDNLTVKNIVSYAQLKYDLINPVVGNYFDLADFNPYGQAFMNLIVNSRLPAGVPPAVFQPYAPGTILNFTDANSNGVGHTAHQSTFTEELQFQGKGFDNRLVWQSGAYFENSRPLGEVGSLSGNLAYCPDLGLTCSNPFFGFGSVGRTESQKTIRTIGLYTQASYDITDQLKLTGGIRYTWDRQETTGRLVNYQIAYNPYGPPNQFVQGGNPTCVIVTATITNNCTETITQKSSAPTWLVGLDFKPTDDILTYVKYARGYRTGGISFQLPPAIRTYDEEKVDSYEAGLKTTWSGPIRGVFNVAAFYNNFSNQQLPIGVVPKVVGSAANATGVANAGKSRIWGVEVDSSLELFDGFVASVGYSYLNTKLKKISYPVFDDPIYFLDPGRSPQVGDSLPYAPKNKLTFSLNYRLPIDENVGKITVGATYTHTDRQITNYAFRTPQGKLMGYSLLQPRDLLDLNLSWNNVAGSPVDLSLFANNITKQHYYNYILDVQQGFQSAQLGLPRMYGMRLRYTFGR
jgi:iron complex outermembrane receptor protein